MISRIGLRSTRGASGLVRSTPCAAARHVQMTSLRSYSDKTIFDLPTGKTIVLADPERPEFGDYKNPKPVLAQDKDPYQKYDDQQNRRNLNDPVHIDEDMLDVWSPDYYDFVSNKEALKQNGIFFGLIAGVAAIVAYLQLNPEKPAMIRSYPFNGLANELGATSEDNAAFYQAKPDLSAEKECGVLPADGEIESNKKEYLAENKGFGKV
ncbi:uncharacterized protein LODBEIA_P37100 [Lodderomyces beijingensis]|uniref:Uncharacterized protein n=1 Tax=Lodderomyces beijingensis TaxID=1775926 RepID=A0ABP0ZQY3_9ASCO